MPRTYTENAKRWAEKVEIDYFTQFIKAWIPFNAWFKNSFDEDQERQIINALKNGTNNPLQGRITRLLEQNDEDANEFKVNLARLHYHLERHNLENRGERLTFARCFLGNNPVNQISNKRGYNGRIFTVERGVGRALQQNQSNSNIYCEIVSSRHRPKTRFKKLQTRFNRQEIEEDPMFITLNDDERVELLLYYERINPRLMINLLDPANSRPSTGLSGRNAPPSTITVGTIQFCDHPEYIFAGLVEVLYGLRNMLFHGEITPTPEYNEVYEPAYFILRRFLKAIV